MKNILILLSLIISITLQISLNAQSFRISHIHALNYSYDKFANEVYYVTYSNLVFIKNLTDSTVRESPFPKLPAFAHNSHQCAYRNGDSLFVYNFDNNRKFLVYDALDYNEYAFSPNDEYLLFYLHYFSCADSSIHDMIFSPSSDFEYEWINETTLITPLTEVIYFLCSYNFVTNILDTILVSPSSYTPISTFAYNRGNDLLYYSLAGSNYPKIHSYNLYTQFDSIVYDPAISDSDNVCWRDTYSFQSMEWSPDYKRMAFFGFILEVGGTIYAFSPDSGKLYQYTDCGGKGYEDYLKWLNNDTIAYHDANDDYIYGFILDNPLAVKETPRKIIPSVFEVTAYPNPFNGTVIINLKGKIKEPEIKIYNINGEEIKRFDKLQGSGYQYKQVWNGRNNSGENVSSGVYFIIVRDKADPLSIKGTSKIVYLK